MDIPGERIGVTGLPAPPDGASIRRVDVIIRVERRTRLEPRLAASLELF